jgi:hypothetical protein
MAGPGAGPGDVPGAAASEPEMPPDVLRSWDQAEAKLFPLVMAQPELYEQALGAIQQLVGRLRQTCPDMSALLAAHHRGGDLLSDEASGIPGVLGVPPGLIAAAACAMRYRELVALTAARRRLAAMAEGRLQGRSWAVVGETGHADRAPYVPYQRIEAEVRTGRAVIVSIGPDETLSRAVYRLDEGQIDMASGALQIGDQVGSYLDPDEAAAALRQVQGDSL